jgi:hypothetical protein
VQEAGRLEIEQLAEDVDARVLEIVAALPAR